MSRIRSIAHLTLLDLEPPALVATAAAAGFDRVGIRVSPASAGEQGYSIRPRSLMLRDTLLALDDHGMRVLDVEAMRVDARSSRDQWMTTLEVGAALGAQVLNVIGADEDLDRFADTFAVLAADSEGFGIRASLEPISYCPLRTVAQARDIIARAGRGGIMLDTLHFVRAGQAVSDLRDLPEGTISVVQISDGPATPPTDIPIPAMVPLGQALDGTPRQQESRIRRLLPGDGVFPLHDILRALPDDVPVSVEVPDVQRVAREGARRWAESAFVAMASTLEGSARISKAVKRSSLLTTDIRPDRLTNGREECSAQSEAK